MQKWHEHCGVLSSPLPASPTPIGVKIHIHIWGTQISPQLESSEGPH